MAFTLYSQQPGLSNPSIPRAPVFGFDPPSREVDPMSPDGNVPAFSDPPPALGHAATTMGDGRGFSGGGLGGLKPPNLSQPMAPQYNRALGTMVGGGGSQFQYAQDLNRGNAWRQDKMGPTALGSFGKDQGYAQESREGQDWITGRIEADRNREAPQKQGRGVPLDFEYRGTNYSTDGQGQSYVNGRASGRSENEIVRKYLKSKGITPRIDARATLSPRANRDFM